MQSPGGYEYQGDWVEGVKQGTGKITYPDGAVYEGQIVNGQREGQGTLTMPDGLVYVGLWRDGRLTPRATRNPTAGSSSPAAAAH